MERHHPDHPEVIDTGRRGVVVAIAATIAAFCGLVPRTARADIVGDIGVLLAQLEQQINLVSHAISTVQNLVRTVESLGHVVTNTKMLLQKAGSGGLTGFLDAAQGFTSLARTYTSDLMRVDYDAKFWQSQVMRWAGEGQIKPDDFQSVSKSLKDMDRRRLANVDKTQKAYAGVSNSYEALNSSIEASKASDSADGIVALQQYANRQNVNLAAISLHEDAVATLHSQAYTDEMVRESMEREANDARINKAKEGLTDVNTSGNADLPYERMK